MTLKETFHVKLERPSLNRGGGIWHYLSPTYYALLSSLLRQLKNIHTWAHLALATHMKAGWVSHPQVALMTLKIKAHTLKSLQLLFRLELKKPLGWEVKHLQETEPRPDVTALRICRLCLCFCFVFQTALKGEDEPQPSKKTQPGKKRKNNKKNQSRKRTNAPPDKEVCKSY